MIAVATLLWPTSEVSSQCETVLTATSVGWGKQLGTSVSLAGDLAIAGAPGDFEAHGSVFVFRRSGFEWTHEATLTAPDLEVGTHFGAAVATDGQRVAVLRTQEPDSDDATIYFFHQVAGTWVTEAQFLIQPAQGDGFFTELCVAIDGDHAVVGNEGGDLAYLYSRSSGSWLPAGTLDGLSTVNNDEFGWSVALDQDVLVVGSRSPLNAPGKVHVFRFISGQWTEEAELSSPQALPGDFLGGVSVDGDLLAFGTRTASSPLGVNRGTVSLYRYNGATWAEEAWIYASDGMSGDRFGMSVGVDGDHILVASPFNDFSSAYIFENVLGVWTQVDQVSHFVVYNPALQSNPVSAADGFSLIGAPSGHTGSDSGAAVVLAHGGSDCDSSGLPDYCDVVQGLELDCNQNGVPDSCDIASAMSIDANGNSVPDECDPDCNGNGQPDDLDILGGLVLDANLNGVPDPCDADCNQNGIPDDLDIQSLTSPDIDANLIPDECDPDCNQNMVPDSIDFAAGSPDCDGGGVLDLCDIAAGTLPDLDGNGRPDLCDFRPSPPLVILSLPDTRSAAINVHGDFVGTQIISGETRVLLYTDANGLTILDTYTRWPVTFEGHEGVDINDSGQVLALAAEGGMGIRSLRSSGSGWVNLGTLGGNSVDPAGMNSSGSVVGICGGPLGTSGYLFTDALGIQSIMAPPPFMPMHATDLNDSGHIVGTFGSAPLIKGFRFTPPDTFEDLGFLPNHSNLNPVAISSHGDVVGFVDTSNGFIAFLYTDDAGLVGLPPLPGATYARATDINDSRFVVGHSWSYGLPHRAVVWVPGRPLPIDLNTLVALPAGAHLYEAEGINAAGQIVGKCVIGSDDYAFRLSLPDCDYLSPIDVNGDATPDVCVPDCDGNGVPDSDEIQSGAGFDCNLNGLMDSCEADCNGNGTADECDVTTGTSNDCDGDGALDECELATGSALDCNANGVPDECDIAEGTSADANLDTVPDECQSPPYVRGDANADAELDLADAVFTLGYLFASGPQPTCRSAADSNADSAIDVGDPIYTLAYLFSGGAEPPPPFPTCAVDLDLGALGCEARPPCP